MLRNRLHDGLPIFLDLAAAGAADSAKSGRFSNLVRHGPLEKARPDSYAISEFDATRAAALAESRHHRKTGVDVNRKVAA
jgi:hypothetical protein